MADPRIKPCCVVLVPCTPKMQLGLSAELRNAIQERNMLTTRTKKKILLDLDEINETNVEKDRKRRRSRAVEEILTSEISYLKQLKLIVDYFMKPIMERSILTTDEFQTLFGSIQSIYKVNSELLSELKKNPENIAQAFSQIAPYFKVYSIYAFDYKKSLQILQDAPINNLEFCKFLEQQESRPEVQTKLSALLITPIQRVPRYRLLLKQVLDHTSPRHPSYSLIIGSLRLVEEAAAHINSLLEEQENTQRLLELQRSLQNGYPAIIKPGRKLLKQGTLMKMSQRGSHSYKRYFVLMNDILMYCKLKKDNPLAANSIKCSCILPLNKCKVTKMESKGALKITCQNETLIVHHEHAAESQEWANVLEEAIKTYINNRRTLRKDSSSRRPVYKKDIREYQDIGISPGKPRRKRLIEDTELENVFKNISNDSEDSDRETTSCFPLRTAKGRKPIRKFNRDISVHRDLSAPRESSVHRDLSAPRESSVHQELPPVKITKYMETKQDTLYPLRQHFMDRHSTENDEIYEMEVDCEVAVTNQVESTNGNEVFVFGQSNEPKGFRFNVTNILTGLGNSVRRMFGFGENN